MKTPGVYIVEKEAFPNSIFPVPTSIPAFIGYTRNTSYGDKILLNKAIEINSFADFLEIFGKEAPLIKFDIDDSPTDNHDFTLGDNNDTFAFKPTGPTYRMHSALWFFYQNGGGKCTIISVGDYDSPLSLNALKTGIKALEKENEPTLLLIPDAIDLMDPKHTKLKDRYAAAYALQADMINHCGAMGNRMAILDIPRGYWGPIANPLESIIAFRENVNPIQATYNSYAAAYCPWLYTNLYQESALSVANLSDNALIKVDSLLKIEAAKLEYEDAKGSFLRLTADLTSQAAAEGADELPKEKSNLSEEEKLRNKRERQKNAHQSLLQISNDYKLIISALLKKINLMPPAAAMAGIYTLGDNNRGVWQAPANVSINGVIASAINITPEMQEDLNVPLSGQAINAIRTFIGQGVLVWGVRTLDGNSQDWRYISVRRTAIYLEQSIKLGLQAYIFAPNDANTWVTINSLVSNFLNEIWKRGGLMGSTPANAYSVAVGLGSTMTAEDIFNGILRVSVKVAISHPAEFIELSFMQEMEKS
tara:strand:+ start:3695 stop:5296 length:1602 start_codon:yes stop_codon:yes gene_type:complete